MPRLRLFDRTDSGREPITSTGARHLLDDDDDLITFNEGERANTRRRTSSPDSRDAIPDSQPASYRQNRDVSRDRHRRRSYSRRRSHSRSHSRSKSRSYRRRKDMEVRRFNGKDNVDEYLAQFEMAAQFNGWTESEMTAALLCALDGPARGILSDFDEPTNARYSTVKRALQKRFNPADVTDIHEQALSQLRLQRGQNIRELAQEVGRLARKAYPDLGSRQRERFSIKALLNAIGDRDTIFYMKDKDPRDLEDACSIFERYEALTGQIPKRGAAARSLKSNNTDDPTEHKAIDSIRQEMATLQQETNKRLDILTEAMTKLSSSARRQPEIETSDQRTKATIPKTPCPKCRQHGHWARDCPKPNNRKAGDECLECGQYGHHWRQCPNQGNGSGPTSAPNARSQAPHHRQ